MVDALALTTTTLSGLTAAVAMLGGGWAQLRAQQAGETTRTHFYLTAPAEHLWRPTPGRSLDIARLCEGAGISFTDATFSRLPASTWTHAYSGTGDSGRCLITIPSDAATGFKHAAAGCGAIAVKVPTEHTRQVERSARLPLSEGFKIPTEPGWFLGLNGYGRAVEIFPVPGSTVIVTGPIPLVQMALQQMPWLPGLFSVTQTESPAHFHDLEPAWRAAWDASQTRIVAAPPGAIPATLLAVADIAVELSSEPGRCVLCCPREVQSDKDDAMRSKQVFFSLRLHEARTARTHFS